jgi:hypothetical protein
LEHELTTLSASRQNTRGCDILAQLLIQAITLCLIGGAMCVALGYE